MVTLSLDMWLRSRLERLLRLVVLPDERPVGCELANLLHHLLVLLDGEGRRLLQVLQVLDPPDKGEGIGAGREGWRWGED